MATIYAKNKQTGEWERVGPAANATDSTLTLAGSPADAKATGEALEEIRNQIGDINFDDIVNNIAKPDWNQNDPTTPDYIKNRTHYSEFSEGIVKNYCLPEMTLTNGTIPVASAKLVANNQYIVECNGEIYNVTAQEAEVEGLMCVAVGNIGLMVDGNSTGEPFVYL